MPCTTLLRLSLCFLRINLHFVLPFLLLLLLLLLPGIRARMSFTRENQLTLEDGHPFNVLQATEGCATESGNVLISFEETLPFVDESGIPSGYALGRTEGQHMGQLNGPLSTRNLQLADLDHVPPGTQMTQPGSGVSEWLSDDWLNIVAQNAPQSSWPPVLNDGNCIFNPLRQHDAVTMAPMTDRQRSQSWWAMSHTVSRGDHIGSRQDDGIANNCADYPAGKWPQVAVFANMTSTDIATAPSAGSPEYQIRAAKRLFGCSNIVYIQKHHVRHHPRAQSRTRTFVWLELKSIT